MDTAAQRGLTFINADIRGGIVSLRVAGSQIASVGAAPEPDDTVVDLQGDRLLPGLINAHDHLQLNNFGRLKYRERYVNVRDWITDVGAHTQASRILKVRAALPRDERLLLGAVKNILSGVTTVAHHDPLYEYLSGESCPVRVVTHYGWSHSLLIDGEERVRESYRQTPEAWPWIIHAAEGTDAEAETEFDRLEALGCVGANTLIVHGVALDEAQRARLVQARAGLIWCPASNLHLFDRTAQVLQLIELGCVAMGSDSRLSGARDLLGELNLVRKSSGIDEATLESLVTVAGARLLRLGDRGVLRAGAVADLLILPRQMPLSAATRADVRMVMIKGRMLYGDTRYAEAVASASADRGEYVPVRVDGRRKAMSGRLAAMLAQSSVPEPGVDVSAATWRAA